VSRRVSWVLIALSGLALLAGCGESEKQTYTNKIKKISKQLATEQQQVTGGKSATSLKEAGTQFRRLQSVFARLGKRFGEVKPPADVKNLHQRLTVLVRSFADSLTPSVQAADSGNVKRFQSTTSVFKGTLAGFQTQINSLNSEYKAKGYKLT